MMPAAFGPVLPATHRSKLVVVFAAKTRPDFAREVDRNVPISLEEGTVDRNDPHRPTGFRFFDEEDQMQYIVEGFCCEEASAGGKKGRTFTIRNVTTNGLETMWEDSLREYEYLEEAKAKAGAHDIEDSDEGDAED